MFIRQFIVVVVRGTDICDLGVLEAPFDESSIAADEFNLIAVRKNSALNYQVLNTSIDFCPLIDCSLFDLRELKTVDSTPKHEHQDYKEIKNATDSEGTHQRGLEDRRRAPSFPEIISTQFEIQDDVGILGTRPPLHLDIEESDAELIVSEN
jgi:hypothetical protein